MIVLLALLIGIVAGLRAMTAPAAVSWAARSRLARSGRQLAGVPRLCVHAVDPDGARAGRARHRSAPHHAQPHGARPVRRRASSRAACRARRSARRRQLGAGLVAGIVGAVIGTLGGRAVRARLAAAFGSDRPAAFLEDAVAIGGALLIMMALPMTRLRRHHHRRRPGRASAGRPADRRRHDGRAHRAQAVRRHLRQHRLHADQDAGGQRVRGASRPPRRATTASCSTAPSRSTWPA